jgi:hypothetical protein
MIIDTHIVDTVSFEDMIGDSDYCITFDYVIYQGDLRISEETSLDLALVKVAGLVANLKETTDAWLMDEGENYFKLNRDHLMHIFQYSLDPSELSLSPTGG